VNPVHAIRRLAGILAWLASVPVVHVPARPAAVAGASPGARLLSWRSRHCGQAGEVPAVARSGRGPRCPGRRHARLANQLIAAQAALVAAALAVTAYRMRAARRRVTTAVA